MSSERATPRGMSGEAGVFKASEIPRPTPVDGHAFTFHRMTMDDSECYATIGSFAALVGLAFCHRPLSEHGPLVALWNLDADTVDAIRANTKRWAPASCDSCKRNISDAVRRVGVEGAALCSACRAKP